VSSDQRSGGPSAVVERSAHPSIDDRRRQR